MAETQSKSSDTHIDVLKSGKYSDLNITCRGWEFRVHRVIVGSASAFIDAACTRPFKEATSRTIDFPEEDPSITSRAILFMYTGDYDARSTPTFLFNAIRGDAQPPRYEIDNDFFENLKTHLLVYKCADMLGIDKLTAMAAKRLLDGALAVLPDQAPDNGFPDILRLVYENTNAQDSILRLPMTGLCARNHGTLSDAAVEVIQEYEPSMWKAAVFLVKEQHQEHKEKVEKVIKKINAAISGKCTGLQKLAGEILD